MAEDMVKPTILIVDDDPNLRKTLSDILGVKGYLPLDVAAGKEALEKAAEERPAVALIDIRLEDISGLDVMKGIKECSPDTECILITGYASRASAIEAIHLGVYSYFQKPYNMDQLLLTVQRAIEKRKTEAALRENEERFRSLVESASDGIVISDEAGVITMWNNGARKMFGFTAVEMIGKPVAALMSATCRPSHRESMRRLAAPGGGKHIGKTEELEGLRKDGGVFPLELSLSTWRLQEERFFAAITRDITKRKQIEARLQQAQKLEAIGTLAGGIAHDFNNILSNIIGYTELVLEDVDRNSSQYENLTEVLHAGNRAAELVKQILAFSRQNNRKRKPVQIDSIVKEALKLLRASLPSTIEIRENIETDAGIVLANPTQIHRVVMNLCTNALHAMHNRNDVLEITLTRTPPDADNGPGHPDLKPGDYLRLVVADTGDGIPPEIRDRIFDPYFTTKDKDKGTGLWLSVVHGIVRGHGGQITVDSEIGMGTTFTVFLPLVEKSAYQDETELPAAIPFGNERILIVDDEEPIVRLQRRTLEHLGYRVASRTSSVEAFEAFYANPEGYDLMITDMTMPNMSGDLLAMEIKKVRADLPVILCTGFSEEITREKAAVMGIDAFLMKPVTKKELAETIRKVFDHL